MTSEFGKVDRNPDNGHFREPKDLMAALRASLDEAKARRLEPTTGAVVFRKLGDLRGLECGEIVGSDASFADSVPR